MVLVGAQDTERPGESVALFRRLGPDRAAGSGRTAGFLPDGAASAGLVDVVRLPGGDLVAAGWLRRSGAAADDCWVTRLRPDGERLWDRALGGPSQERCYFVEPLPGGDLLVGGRSDEDPTGKGKGSASGATWRLDPADGALRPSGEALVRCDGCRRSAFQDAAALPDGGVVLVGWATDPGRGDDDLWVLKRGPEGRTAWQRRIGGPGPDLATSVLVAPSGDVLVLGYATPPDAKATSGLAMALSAADGTTRWSREVAAGEGGNDKLQDGAVLPDGTLVAVGTASTDAKAPLKGWIVRVAADGGLLDDRLLDDPPSGRLLAVEQDGRGGLVAVGAARGRDRPDFDGWIARLGDAGAEAARAAR